MRILKSPTLIGGVEYTLFFKNNHMVIDQDFGEAQSNYAVLEDFR